MYKLRKVIAATENIQKKTALPTEAKFSYKDIYDFLSSVEELRGQKITAVECSDGSCEFTVGNTVYTLIAG